MFDFVQIFYNDTLVDWIEAFLAHQGIIAPIFLLLIEESGIPIPVPGDIVISYTGYQVSKGQVTYTVAFYLLLIAVLAGSSILFYISRRFGHRLVVKFGRYIHVDEKKLEIVEEKFRKYGPLVIILGRHIPGFRIPITVFSGISKVKYSTFIISTFISVIFWIPFYLALGEKLGPKTTKLFHGHPGYYFLALIPFGIFIGTIIYMRLKHRHTKTLHTK